MLAPVMKMEWFDPSVGIFTQLRQGWKRSKLLMNARASWDQLL